ncbi:MAG: hypothetical protein OXI61_07700 [Candidatus Poribacteria bacterium]|nr:hypothetical protein [Candidatus Poribacteria bacterium]
MEPRFTRGEYWLLETAVDKQFPVSALMANNLEEYVNKKGHGLTRTALIETLHRLITWGLISAKNKVDAPISTSEEIERALDEPRWSIGSSVDRRTITRYELTQEGGTQWEAFAAPDWQKYIDAGCHYSEDYEYGMWELICADKVWLERYFESMCFYDPHEVTLESVERDYIAPWQATYWKQLDGAHRIRFREPDESEQENFEPSPNAFPDMSYFDRAWCAWR